MAGSLAEDPPRKVAKEAAEPEAADPAEGAAEGPSKTALLRAV